MSNTVSSTVKEPTTFNALVEPVEFTNVYGKKLWYLIVHTRTGNRVINVGEKTYEDVQNLINNDSLENK